MTKSIFVFLFAASILAAQSDSITGTVVDTSARPVPNATVECGAQRTNTDAEGRFAFSATTACDATVRGPGFEAARLHLAAGTPARVTLMVGTLSETVVVSATRTPTTVEESGVSATVFTGSDIAVRQYAPVANILRDAPGLAFSTTGRRGSLESIFTRGGTSTSTLFLLDGVPVNDPGGQVDLAHLTSSGLDRIEVIRGPESALFGAEASSGVVQLFSARGSIESDTPHGSVSYERGSFQTDRWIANVNGGLAGRIDYSLTADQFHTVGKYQNDYYRNTTGAANLGFRIAPSTQVRGIFRSYDSMGGNDNQVGYGILDLVSAQANRDSTLLVRVDDTRGKHYVQNIWFDYRRLRFLYTDAVYQGPFNVAALVRDVTDPTPRTYLVQQVPANFPAAQVPAGLRLATNSIELYPGDALNITERKGFNYQGTYTHPGGALVFGYEFEREGGLISTADVSRDNNGFFVHEQYNIGRRVFLTGGIRAEHSSTFGQKIAPRGSATFAVAGEHGIFSSTFVRFSAGRGITEPSLLQNFARESFYVGNAALRPEKTSSYDAGIVQEWFGRRLRTEATVFRNSFEDLIVFDFSNFPGTWKNVDASWARGLELSASGRMFGFVRVGAAYTRLYTKITKSNAFGAVGQELVHRPKNSGSAWLSVTPRKWTFMVGGRFVGEAQDSDFVFGVTRNPGFGNMYFTGSYMLGKHITPFLRVDNLLNEQYAEVLGYPSLTRNATGGVRVSW